MEDKTPVSACCSACLLHTGLAVWVWVLRDKPIVGPLEDSASLRVCSGLLVELSSLFFIFPTPSKLFKPNPVFIPLLKFKVWAR